MKKNSNFNIPLDQLENQSAQLAVIAGLITTLGDGLATVAAAMALQEARQSNQNEGSPSISNAEIRKLQHRIDRLDMELKQLKKMLRHQRY